MPGDFRSCSTWMKSTKERTKRADARLDTSVITVFEHVIVGHALNLYFTAYI